MLQRLKRYKQGWLPSAKTGFFKWKNAFLLLLVSIDLRNFPYYRHLKSNII